MNARTLEGHAREDAEPAFTAPITGPITSGAPITGPITVDAPITASPITGPITADAPITRGA